MADEPVLYRLKARLNLRSILLWAAGIGVMTFAAIYFGKVVALALMRDQWKDLAMRQFPAMVGLPSAAVAAVFLVILFRAEAGPIGFRALGFEFKGASGPIVMWVVCFAVIAVAIHLVWLS